MTSSKPIRVEIVSGTENIAVTGATPVALTVPPHATYAEIYIDVDNAAIRWTKDGTPPADDNGEQENAGTTVYLEDVDSINGFRALAIDNTTGALDPAMTAQLTGNFWNISPDED